MVRRKRPRSPTSFDRETVERIDKRQELVCMRGLGISYEWISGPYSWRSGDGGQFEWSSVDGLFQGVSKEEFDRVLSRFSSVKLNPLLPHSAADADAEKKEAWEMDTPYLDAMYLEKLIPDHLFGSSNLPTPKEMEGDYEIIYYAGETDAFAEHHRTARGTLTITCSVGERGTPVISGTVTMHPCMEEIDVIPFGGNFGFVEECRVQREGQGDDDYPGDTTTPTGIIKIKVTDPPYGLCKNNGYRSIGNFVLHGELRVFRQKVGAGITSQVPFGMYRNDQIPRSIVPFSSTEEAEALNKAHYQSTCSWLHKYTILDEASALHVGRFLCPPPIFFFQEGDIQIDIDWKDVATCCCCTKSCIVARRVCRDSVTKGPGPLISDNIKFEREMSRVQVDIDRLERKKDMIWLAFECADILRKDNNDSDFPSVVFTRQDKKAEQCLMYMDEAVFNEQISLYGLHLTNIEFFPNWNTYRQLNFSRIQ